MHLWAPSTTRTSEFWGSVPVESKWKAPDIDTLTELVLGQSNLKSSLVDQICSQQSRTWILSLCTLLPKRRLLLTSLSILLVSHPPIIVFQGYLSPSGLAQSKFQPLCLVAALLSWVPRIVFFFF